jgi:hypothetical protein
MIYGTMVDGAVGLSDDVGLSDNCRTVGRLSDGTRALSQRNHCRTLSDDCRTLSDCRTVGAVGLSDNCRTLSESTVGLSDRGSGYARASLYNRLQLPNGCERM